MNPQGAAHVSEDAGPRFGFYGRLKAEFPSQVIIDVTEICNLACLHCPHPTFKKSEHYAGSCLEPELNAKAVEEVQAHGYKITQFMRYTGEGEPLIHKQIYEMLAYAVKNSGTTVTLTTNGALMDERHAEKLLATGVHVVDISIDAYSPETYAKIRVNGDLSVTRANVLNLIRASRQDGSCTKVVVSYIEQSLNFHETKDFESFWKDNGTAYVVVRRLHSGAGAILITAERMRQENAMEARRPCTYPWERIVLNPRGNLCFCPADWTHGSSIVDYKTTTIKEIWQGEFYRKLREAHMSNQYANHGFCGQCPDWKATRWPDEGRSYANMIEEFKERG